MSTTTSSPVNESAVDLSKVRDLAEQAINSTCERHGVQRNQLTQEAIDDAYRSASARVAHEKELAADQGYQALQAERERNRQLEAQLAVLRQVQPKRNESGNAGHARSSRLADSEIVRSQMGTAAWNSLTLDGRLAACGIAPATVTAATREEARNIFGRSSNAKVAADLYQTAPTRYRELKTIANVLGLVGQ